MRGVDLSGKKFGRLTALEDVPEAKRASCRCLCECGRIVVVTQSNLTTGNSTSCGCKRPDIANGLYGTPEYTAFMNAKNRCDRAKDVRYPQYGGRGIKFLFRDMNEFIADVGMRPSPDHSLDRIETNGHYEPGNVRWATKDIQARNKTTSRLVEIDGATRPLKDWCEIYGQPYKRVWERIADGSSPLEALTRPPKQQRVTVEQL